jgi:phospholipid/cholesterol/gamma-HCH transport system ATP-binding protein
MSVYENLLYPLKAHTKMQADQMHEKIMAQLQKFGLESAAALHPARISGGMQKRVGLARAMMLDPEVILYDEPTAGLDPLNTKNIQDIILKLKATGVTSILVTHDIPTAFAVCDRFAFLTQGQIHITDSHDLQNNPNSSIQQFLRGEVS